MFAITLNSPTAVYMAGQNVEGYVTVDLNDGMKTRGKLVSTLLYFLFRFFFSF